MGQNPHQLKPFDIAVPTNYEFGLLLLNQAERWIIRESPNPSERFAAMFADEYAHGRG